MHIYGTQCDFMHRSCWNHSNFENSWFYYVIWTSDPQNHCLLGSRNRVAVNFFNRYVIYWVVPCERARPELSEYVWQRGVGSLEGRVTAGRSWPFFQKIKRSWGAVLKKVSRLPEIFLGQILLREFSKCNLETSLRRIWHKKISGSRLTFFYASLFLLANHILPPSPDFGQE